MKLLIKRLFLFTAVLALAGTAQVSAQRAAQQAKVAAQPVAKPIIFAVLNDGKLLEPIAYVEKGKLVETVDGSDEGSVIKAFTTQYYKPNAAYRLIFGGANAGTVTVSPTNPQMECGPNMAQATTASTRATLKGHVMGLATNVVSKKQGSGVRRLPTWPERNEIDAVIRANMQRTMSRSRNSTITI
jgi:hypothetical protein